nr:hypothetical protein Itr_chr06CG12020 [Ipomoea trifida]GMD03649.1 hypothetical protein Iba_chr06aCG10880 [Ipomoea batatas]
MRFRPMSIVEDWMEFPVFDFRPSRLENGNFNASVRLEGHCRSQKTRRKVAYLRRQGDGDRKQGRWSAGSAQCLSCRRGPSRRRRRRRGAETAD